MSTAAQHFYRENPKFELAGIVEKIEANETQVNAESAVTSLGVVFGKKKTEVKQFCTE